MFCRVTDIITNDLSELTKSELSSAGGTNRWTMTVTLEPTTSMAGPRTSVLCFYAVDITE